MIELKNVSRQYVTKSRTFSALTNIDLQITAGERLGIVGRSGSGKSTLLNLIAGIDQPTEGTVTVDGVRIHGLKENQLAAWRGKTVGVVFQFFQLIPTLSIMENVLLAMEFVKVVPAKGRKQRAKELLAQVGLAEHVGKLPAALSGGEQQRAAIARALANDPKIIIADEPTGNLDSKTAADINALFHSLSDTGKTIITVTHDPEVARQADRIITLQDGKLTEPSN